MASHARMYGAAVVRLADRMLLCKATGMPTDGFTIPGTVWAELVSKCAAPHFRTSSFVNVTADADPAREVRLSYHVMTDDVLGYAVLCSADVNRRSGHAAVDEVATLFRRMFVESPSLLTPRMADVFVKPARDLLVRLSGDGEVEAGAAGVAVAPPSALLQTQEKVKKVRVAVDEVRNLALDNVERVLQRGQRIDDMVQATDDLQFQAQGFQRSSRELHNQMWWNSMKGKLIVGGVATVFVLLVLFTFFAGNGSERNGSDATPQPA